MTAAATPVTQTAETAAPGSVDAHRRGRLALGLIAVSLGLTLLTGLLGPSVAEAALPGRLLSPPFWFDASPPAWLVTVLPGLAVCAVWVYGSPPVATRRP